MNKDKAVILLEEILLTLIGFASLLGKPTEKYVKQIREIQKHIQIYG
jgi:hypothetical protein